MAIAEKTRAGLAARGWLLEDEPCPHCGAPTVLATWAGGGPAVLLDHDGARHCRRACRMCGCTQDRACPGGCYWVEFDLCSACAGKGAARVN